MRKLSYLFIILLFVVACGSSEPKSVPASNVNNDSDAVVEESEDVNVEEVSAPEESIASSEAIEEEEEAVVDVEETAVSAQTLPSANPDFIPATNPEGASAIRSHDWKEGATEPTVTIIEYGDYQ